MSDLPYLPLWISKYDARTKHLSLEEDGAYMRLLRLCWSTPGGTIPANDKWVMRHLRVDAETYERVVRVILSEFFKTRRGRYVNDKLKEIFDEKMKKGRTGSEKARKAGIASAKKRQEKHSTPSSKELNLGATIPEPEPYPEREDGVVVGAGALALNALEADCRKWANGSLIASADDIDIFAIERLLAPEGGGDPCIVEDVRRGITKAAASLHANGQQVKSLAYFEKPIIRERDKRLAPLPEVEIIHARQQRQSADGASGHSRRPAYRGRGGDFGVAQATRDEMGAWDARAGLRVEDRYEDDVIDGAPLDAQRRAS